MDHKWEHRTPPTSKGHGSGQTTSMVKCRPCKHAMRKDDLFVLNWGTVPQVCLEVSLLW